MIVATLLIVVNVVWEQGCIIRKKCMTPNVYGFLVLSGVPLAALCGVFVLHLNSPSGSALARLPVKFERTGWVRSLHSGSGREDARTTVAERSRHPRTPIAVVCKVIRDVTSKPMFKEWQVARKGEWLTPGDRIKTGNSSFAAIKFRDNSMVRVREQTDLTVTGVIRGKTTSRSVNLTRGVVGFIISRQRSHEGFQFTSPTSVASIRGTEGTFASGEFVDTLTVLEGVVLMTNMMSQKVVEVRAGGTGISHPTGWIISRGATLAELISARALIKYGHEVPHSLLAGSHMPRRKVIDNQKRHDNTFVSDRGVEHMLIPPIGPFEPRRKTGIQVGKLFSVEKVPMRTTPFPIQ